MDAEPCCFEKMGGIRLIFWNICSSVWTIYPVVLRIHPLLSSFHTFTFLAQFFFFASDSFFWLRLFCGESKKAPRTAQVSVKIAVSCKLSENVASLSAPETEQVLTTSDVDLGSAAYATAEERMRSDAISLAWHVTASRGDVQH